jgi:hypothetical protein
LPRTLRGEAARRGLNGICGPFEESNRTTPIRKLPDLNEQTIKAAITRY